MPPGSPTMQLPFPMEVGEALAGLALRTTTAIVVGDAEGLVAWVNPAWERLSGVNASEAVGKPVAELLARAQIDASALRFIATHLRRGEAARLELEIADAGRRPRWLDLEVLPTAPAGERGAPAPFLALARDVTERHEAAAALAESEARYRTLVEQCPSPVVVHRGPTIIYVNRAAYTLWGASDPAELLGRSVFDLMLPEERTAAEQRIRAVTEKGVVPEVTVGRVLRRDGTSLRVEVHTAPLLLEGAPAVQAILVPLDERAARGPELPAHAPAGAIAGGVWVGGLARELDRVAERLGATMDGLLSAPEAPRTPRALRPARHATAELELLASALRAAAGATEARCRAVDLASFVLELSGDLESEAEPHARLTCQVEAGLPLAHADPVQLRTILRELVRNAAAAAPRPPGRIQVQATRIAVDARWMAEAVLPADLPPGEYPALVVRDGGAGMAREVRERIFEPFFTTRRGARGLGLPLVLGLVRGQGAAIRVESAPRCGATFTVVLPAARRRPASS